MYSFEPSQGHGIQAKGTPGQGISQERDEKTGLASSTAFQYAGANTRCSRILVTQQFLDCANVLVTFQQVRSERMPQGVTGGVHVYARLASCSMHRARVR